jgi:hypothetical protein
MHDRPAFIRSDLERNPVTNCRKSLPMAASCRRRPVIVARSSPRGRVHPVPDVVLKAYAARFHAALLSEVESAPRKTPSNQTEPVDVEAYGLRPNPKVYSQ